MISQTIRKTIKSVCFATFLTTSIATLSSCSKKVSESDYISFDTIQGQLTERSSMGLIEIILNGSGANYSYYIAEGAEMDGDLTAGNKVEVVLGTPKEETDRKLVVSFKNVDDNFTRYLKSTKGLWMRQEVSQNGGKQASIDLLALSIVNCTNMPVNYRSWEPSSDIMIFLYKSDGTRDTAVIDRSQVPARMTIRPSGIILERKD